MKNLGDFAIWAISEVIGPKLFIIDKPGFVYSNFAVGNEEVFQRIVFLPESMLVQLEEEIEKKYDKKGRQKLYSAGKKFGYNFAAKLHLPTIKNQSPKIIDKGISLILKFILGGRYSKNADVDASIEKKQLSIKIEDYVVCSHSGLGDFFTSGGFAGIWAWALNDKTIEGAHPKCQGRGDKLCEVLCAPKEHLISEKFEFFEETNLNYIFNQEYFDINQPPKQKSDKRSLKILLDTGIFSNDKIMTFKGERFFPVEIEAIRFLEEEILGLPDGEKILFKAAFDIMKKISEDESDYTFLQDFLTALGYGLVEVVETDKLRISSKHFIWIGENPGFEIFKGMASGLISGIKKKNLFFKNMEVGIYEGEYDIILSE